MVNLHPMLSMKMLIFSCKRQRKTKFLSTVLECLIELSPTPYAFGFFFFLSSCTFIILCAYIFLLFSFSVRIKLHVQKFWSTWKVKGYWKESLLTSPLFCALT